MEGLKPNITRRRFLQIFGPSMLALLTGVGTSEIKSFSEYDPMNPQIDVVYQQVPEMTETAHIVHLTDIHFGGPETFVNANVLEQVVEQINTNLLMLGATPSNTALVMTGDWVSKNEEIKFFNNIPRGGETDPRDIPTMLEILKGLKTEHFIGTLGNHDIKYAHRKKLMSYLLSFGINLIDTNAEYYDGEFPVKILGLPDFTELGATYTKSKVLELASRINSQKAPQIIATHNASVADVAGLAALVNNPHLRFLCGHTHGGHIRHPRLAPLIMLNEYESMFIRGMYTRGNTVIQVTEGIGQHPQIQGRQLPAKININVYGR